MEELVNKLTDAVMDEMDGMLLGYVSEYVSITTSEEQFFTETREDLKGRIKDTLTRAARRGILSIREQ